jgi:CHAD domain-containing protein
MPYHLRKDETVAAGIKRIATEELDDAISHLRGKSKLKEDEITHESRKNVKKVRAALRLVRTELDGAYDEENQSLRKVGRELSGLRDAGALITAYESLNLGTQPARDSVRHALQTRRSAIEKEKNPARLWAGVADVLAGVRKRVKSWPLNHDGFPALKKDFQKVYKDGRNALDHIGSQARPEDYHELRKRVKDHWYQVRLLEKVWSDVLRGYEKSLKELETQLGDDHNLVLLQQVITQSPKAYGTDSEVERVLKAIEKKQQDLRDQSIAAARRVYAEPPRRVTDRIETLWKLWK